MARSRFCRVCKDFHDLEQAWPEPCLEHFGSISHGSGPNIRPDGMDAIENPVNGMLYDSKSAYYAAVRAAGCEIVGNDQQRRASAPRPAVGPDMRRALEQLRSR